MRTSLFYVCDLWQAVQEHLRVRRFLCRSGSNSVRSAALTLEPDGGSFFPLTKDATMPDLISIFRSGMSLLFHSGDARRSMLPLSFASDHSPLDDAAAGARDIFSLDTEGGNVR